MKFSQRPSFGFAVAVALIVGLVVFSRYGRGVWRPLKLKITGKQTAEDVLERLENGMKQRFSDLGLLTDGRPLALLAFKEERRLEVWKNTDAGWIFRKSYPFTAFSGRLGPKLREGDRQIPEGLYAIEYLNPNSRYHLSMKVDYPNEFDREKARLDDRELLGDDIFIHGMNATIGCIPIGNPGIEELFYLVAKNGYQNTQVIIAPYDMRRTKKSPGISDIEWEDELYTRLSEVLASFPLIVPGL